MSSLSWYLHRLRAMNVSELTHRFVERWRHLGDDSWAKSLEGSPVGPASGGFPALPDHSLAPEELKQSLAIEAAELIQGNWTLFGWRTVSVGSPPCWHRDPTSGVVVPPGTPAHRLNHRALPDVADSRSIWEINRWSEMVRLAMHGWLNDDVSAIQHAQDWLEDWVELNPPGRGINWTSALECGLRLINFCWFDALVKAAGDQRCMERQQELAEAILPAHVGWATRYLSVGSSANNHRLGELAGLLLAVKRWPELDKITGPTDKLWSGITGCVLSQFAEDGGNREQALHYHLFAFEMALYACCAVNVTEGPVVERLQGAAEFFVRMSHPQEPWDCGDNDDAQIVPLTLNREKAVAEWSAWMSARGDQDAAVLSFWLGEFPSRNSQARDGDWWVAEESGMAVCERDGWKVRVDASPLGFGKIAAHGHCDALHVSIWYGEHALVIDPGTGGYFGSKELRSELAAWTAHNGPQPVGGFKTPQRMGTFLLARHHERPVMRHDDASVRASLQLEGHQLSRSVTFEDGAVVIDDRANGEAFSVRWHLAPECRAKTSNARIIEISRGTERWTASFLGSPTTIKITEARASRCFGRVESCQVIEVTGNGEVLTRWQRVIG